MKTALILTCYNRPAYLQQCLYSLRAADLSQLDHILIIDDCSTDRRTIDLICGFDVPGVRIERVRFPENVGIKQVLKWGFDKVFETCDIAINLDADAVVRRDFIGKLVRLQTLHPYSIVSGFDSRTLNRNPIIAESHDCLVKKYASGINMCISKRMYKSRLANFMEGEGNWDFNISSASNKPNIITKPSLVQHIGLNSSMGHNDTPDVAHDFYVHDLKDVTLFGIDANDPAGIIRAGEISQRHIIFGGVKIITERLFSGREAYSKFCIKDMTKYVDTSHVLIIHADGFIVNPFAWQDEWLQWDYIGATWGYKDGMNNGNGGFSLRSKKLLDILATLDLPNYHPEDCIISRQLRPMLEREHGIRFASDEVCNQFSIEAYGCEKMIDSQGFASNTYTGQFGFHGYSVRGLPEQPAPRKK